MKIENLKKNYYKSWIKSLKTVIASKNVMTGYKDTFNFKPVSRPEALVAVELNVYK
jgi:hypothetical protein